MDSGRRVAVPESRWRRLNGIKRAEGKRCGNSVGRPGRPVYREGIRQFVGNTRIEESGESSRPSETNNVRPDTSRPAPTDSRHPPVRRRSTKVAVRLCWWRRCRWPPANAVMPLPCQPAARSRPLVATWTQTLLRPGRCSPRLGLTALLLVLLILTGRGRAASAGQAATRYASRIVETKSGQIRGILQVRISILQKSRGDGEEEGKEEEEIDGRECGVSSDESLSSFPPPSRIQDLGILQVEWARTVETARSDTSTAARCKWRIVIPADRPVPGTVLRGTSLFPRCAHGEERKRERGFIAGLTLRKRNFSLRLPVRRRSRALRERIDYSCRVIFYNLKTRTLPRSKSTTSLAEKRNLEGGRGETRKSSSVLRYLSWDV